MPGPCKAGDCCHRRVGITQRILKCHMYLESKKVQKERRPQRHMRAWLLHRNPELSRGDGSCAGSPGGMQYDEKNIRRRVYDALNVLMAMGIISRERKEIFWKGLPQGPQLSLDRLRGEKHRLCQKLDQQRRYIAVRFSCQSPSSDRPSSKP